MSMLNRKPFKLLKCLLSCQSIKQFGCGKQMDILHVALEDSLQSTNGVNPAVQDFLKMDDYAE